MKNIILSIIGTAIVIGAIGYFAGWFKEKEEPIGIGNLVEVLKQRELHLVRYNYLDMTFLHRKDDPDKKLLMIAKYPVSVSAAVDLTTVNHVGNVLEMDEPHLIDPNVKFEDAKFINVRTGLRLFVGKKKRQELLETMVARIQESKTRLSADAVRLGILKQAEEEAKKFIEDFLPSFNSEEITVRFVPLEGAATIQNDTINLIKTVGIELDKDLEKMLD